MLEFASFTFVPSLVVVWEGGRVLVCTFVWSLPL